jgi:NAD(P)-dependent dehydrogenase (short-subunit alcohol dehydrogenase family)
MHTAIITYLPYKEEVIMREVKAFKHRPYVPFERLFDLNGKTAIVTGGALGIGYAICQRLAEAGAAVLVADLNSKDAEKGIHELTCKGYKAAFVKTDVTKEMDISNMVESTVKTFGSIDILINCAGIYPVRHLDQMDEALWNKVFSVNIKGMFFCSLKASRQMIKQKNGGSIVNISSICAYRPISGLSAYDSTKGAVCALTRNLALDLGQYGIRVNSVSPGWIATPGNLNPELLEEHKRKDTLAHIVLRRRGEPYEVANIVMCLTSQISSYVTGVDILVDGGWALYS